MFHIQSHFYIITMHIKDYMEHLQSKIILHILSQFTTICILLAENMLSLKPEILKEFQECVRIGILKIIKYLNKNTQRSSKCIFARRKQIPHCFRHLCFSHHTIHFIDYHLNYIFGFLMSIHSFSQIHIKSRHFILKAEK